MIWQRYFIWEMTKVFLLFLCCFYGLYILIDYASHTSPSSHHHTQVQWQNLAKYYLFVFSSRAEILIPFAIMIATIKTLTTANVHREIVALLAGGISLNKIWRPFLAFGLFFTCLLYTNEQFLLPKALKKLRHIESTTKHQKSKRYPELAVNHLLLEDETLLLYQTYDAENEQFFDLFWIPSVDHLFRIKYLSAETAIPTGYYVDELVRQPSGELLQTVSFQERVFPEIHFGKEILKSNLIDPDALSITDLWHRLTLSNPELNERESKIATAFYWKSVMPWLAILVIVAIAPFCVRFSRQTPLFLIYVCGIFGLVIFYFVMDASQVIAKRQVVDPLYAILFPFIAINAFFVIKLTGIRRKR